MRHISQNELIDHLGLANGAFTRWKYDGGTSYLDYMDDIADYLHISRNYLLYGESAEFQETSLLPSEVELYQKLRNLTDTQRSIVFSIVDEFSNQNSKAQPPRENSSLKGME